MTANWTMIFIMWAHTGLAHIGNTPNTAQLDYFTKEACVRAGEELREAFSSQNVHFKFACVERYK